MTSDAFHRYLKDRVRSAHAAYTPDEDPEVEMYDGKVRIFDQRGQSMYVKPLPRYLRQLATMLRECADEIDRLGYER